MLYHVDRKNSLREGQTIQLSSEYESHGFSPLCSNILSELYPRGMTKFGIEFAKKSFVGVMAEDVWVNPRKNLDEVRDILNMDVMHEGVFEIIRMANYHEKPSRLQSFYAHPDIQQAKQYADYFSKSEVVIWEIRGERTMLADLCLLHFSSFAEALANADRYWRGDITESPVLEALVSPPVTVEAEVMKYEPTK